MNCKICNTELMKYDYSNEYFNVHLNEQLYCPNFIEFSARKYSHFVLNDNNTLYRLIINNMYFQFNANNSITIFFINDSIKSILVHIAKYLSYEECVKFEKLFIFS